VWYYSSDGRLVGPLTGNALRALARHGRIQPDSSVWTDTARQWVRAESIRGLFPAPSPRARAECAGRSADFDFATLPRPVSGPERAPAGGRPVRGPQVLAICGFVVLAALVPLVVVVFWVTRPAHRPAQTTATAASPPAVVRAAGPNPARMEAAPTAASGSDS